MGTHWEPSAPETAKQHIGNCPRWPQGAAGAGKFNGDSGFMVMRRWSFFPIAWDWQVRALFPFIVFGFSGFNWLLNELQKLHELHELHELTTSISRTILEDQTDGFQDDEKIELQRPVAQVVQVAIDA